MAVGGASGTLGARGTSGVSGTGGAGVLLTTELIGDTIGMPGSIGWLGHGGLG
jgi:hypothetical protein